MVSEATLWQGDGDFCTLILAWKAQGWNEGELTAIFENIAAENYEVSATHGKVMQSPDKQHKAEFYCELLPQSAKLYLQFIAIYFPVIESFTLFKALPCYKKIIPVITKYCCRGICTWFKYSYIS